MLRSGEGPLGTAAARPVPLPPVLLDKALQHRPPGSRRSEEGSRCRALAKRASLAAGGLLSHRKDSTKFRGQSISGWKEEDGSVQKPLAVLHPRPASILTSLQMPTEKLMFSLAVSDS